MDNSNNQTININSGPETQHLEIRHGEAPEPNNPQPVTIKGHIDAPFNYYQKRAGTTFDRKNAHLEVNTRKKEIILYCDPANKLAPVVTGVIKKYPLLQALSINSDKTYSKDEFKQTMKKNRFLFKDSSACMQLVATLSSLDVKVNQQLKDADDDRGNRTLKYEQTCKSALPETITLHCPIFVEGSKQDITVDICFDVDGSAQPHFWLESGTLFEIIEEQTTQMIADTVADFDDQIAIIYQ